MSETVRPTKKQRDILVFIEQFIAEHGYSPSYREIMNGLNYTSVATVSLHVNSLIRRGHLRKRDRSARSLEVVDAGVAPAGVQSTTGTADGAGSGATSSSKGQGQSAPGAEPDHGAWLVGQITDRLNTLGSAPQAAGALPAALDDLKVLTQALHILGYSEQAEALSQKLQTLATSVNSVQIEA